jgi:hypothetical protein
MANANYFRTGTQIFADVPVAAATAISKGDMICLSSNLAVAASTATDNLTLIGIADSAHVANDANVTTIRVAMFRGSAIYEMPCVSTTFAFGDEFQISGAQQLTKSATDPVAIAVETKATASTTVKVMFMVPVTILGDLS